MHPVQRKTRPVVIVEPNLVNVWGMWLGRLVSLLREGTCAPGDINTQACGNCGTQTQVCSDGCGLGEWSVCEGRALVLRGLWKSRPVVIVVSKRAHVLMAVVGVILMQW